MGVVLFFAATWLTIAAGWLIAVRLPRRRQRLITHPDHGEWLAGLGLTHPADFLALESLVVSGHPGRQVLRLRLGEGDEARTVYLKRQTQVRRAERLRNFLCGRGWASNSLCESKMLEALRRYDLPAPRWLAAGEDGSDAFLLVEAAEGASLPQALQQMDDSQRRPFAAKFGRALGWLHGQGFVHRDLYAKHVLVEPSGDVTLIDWQRAACKNRLSYRDRVRDLAALHATLPDRLAGPAERLELLRAYVGSEKSELRRLARAVEREADRLLRYRHVREKRQASAADQAWVCLEGEALCLTPAMAAAYPGDEASWLSLDRQPVPPDDRP